MIRPARVEEASEVAAFYLDIRQDTVPLVHDLPSVTAFVSHLIAAGGSYVYEADGQVVGWLHIAPGELDHLYCRRGFTGRGIGKALLDYAKTQLPGGFFLYTFQVNEGAWRFYAREGLVEVALGDGSGNEEGQPDVRLHYGPTGALHG